MQTTTPTAPAPRPGGWIALQALLAAAAVLWLLCGCSCQQRIERLRRHCPECFQADTLRLADTLAPDPVRIRQRLTWAELDAPALLIECPQYTLSITTDDDGLDLAAEVRPDTIIIERAVEVPRLVYEAPAPPSPSVWPGLAAAVCVALVALWGALHALRRILRR